jgi:hypothetical protein
LKLTGADVTAFQPVLAALDAVTEQVDGEEVFVVEAVNPA